MEEGSPLYSKPAVEGGMAAELIPVPDSEIPQEVRDLQAAEAQKGCFTGYKIIKAGVYVFFGGQTFLAMVPQGGAAWVQALAEGYSAQMSAVIGIGSILGKFALLIYFSTKRFGVGAPSTYEKIALNVYNLPRNLKDVRDAVRDGTWQWNTIYTKLGTGGVAFLPAYFFYSLTFVALSAFTSTIYKNNFDLPTLYTIAQDPSFVYACGVSSFNGNMVSAAGMLNGFKYHLGKFISQSRSMLQRENSAYQNADIFVGLVTTAIVCAGLWNFFGLALDMYLPRITNGTITNATALLNSTLFNSTLAPPIAYDSANLPVPLAWVLALGALAFAWAALGFTSGMSFLDVLNRNLNIFSREYTPAQRIINLLAFSIALSIVLPGTLPNLFQAAYEKEILFLLIASIVASGIIELDGTIESLGKNLLYYTGADWAIRKAVEKCCGANRVEVLPDDYPATSDAEGRTYEKIYEKALTTVTVETSTDREEQEPAGEDTTLLDGKTKDYSSRRCASLQRMWASMWSCCNKDTGKNKSVPTEVYTDDGTNRGYQGMTKSNAVLDY
jgi:hypothetical protein